MKPKNLPERVASTAGIGLTVLGASSKARRGLVPLEGEGVASWPEELPLIQGLMSSLPMGNKQEQSFSLFQLCLRRGSWGSSPAAGGSPCFGIGQCFGNTGSLGVWGEWGLASLSW